MVAVEVCVGWAGLWGLLQKVRGKDCSSHCTLPGNGQQCKRLVGDTDATGG